MEAPKKRTTAIVTGLGVVSAMITISVFVTDRNLSDYFTPSPGSPRPPEPATSTKEGEAPESTGAGGLSESSLISGSRAAASLSRFEGSPRELLRKRGSLFSISELQYVYIDVFFENTGCSDSEYDYCNQGTTIDGSRWYWYANDDGTLVVGENTQEVSVGVVLDRGAPVVFGASGKPWSFRLMGYFQVLGNLNRGTGTYSVGLRPVAAADLP